MKATSQNLLKHLTPFLPEGSLDYCIELWEQHPFNLKISRSRSSKLGDYRYHPSTKTHTITINNDLNPYAFLVTYLHEVAHLITFKQFGRKVKPHGEEWKETFKRISLPVLSNEIFPDPVVRALANYLKNPKAASCSDHNLYKQLAQFDAQPKTFLADLRQEELFLLGKRVFKKQTLRRTRYVCLEVRSGRKYLISKSAQVEPVQSSA